MKEEKKRIKLAIIGGGYMASIYAINAKELGIETHCFSPLTGIKIPNDFDAIHDIDILKMDDVFSLCKNIGIDGVVATTELTIAVAAYVAEKMAINGMPFQTASVITDKYRNRKAIENINELLQPKFAEAYSIDEIASLGFNYPIILKPKSKGGKRGISVVNQPSDISAAFQYAMKESDGLLPLIVEEFIDGGMECSVESLSYHGKNHIIQVTEKITSGPPHCVELAHHQPARLKEIERKKVENVIDRALSAIGLINGPCHTEIKIKNGNIYLIEFNARPGGDHIAYPLTQLSTGFEYIKGSILISLNKEPNFSDIKLNKKYAGVVFIAEQTKQYKQYFDVCEKYSWCYKKNYVSEVLKPIIHNDGFNTNYFIYCSDKKPDFLEE